jgi:hypothetical protein
MWPVSAEFVEKAMARSRTYVVRVDSLTQALAVDSEVTAEIVEGSVMLTDEQEGRRTFRMVLRNPGGQWSEQSYTNPFFYTRRLRIHRGITIGGEDELVPIGTFQVTYRRARIRAGEDVLYVAGMDLWAALMRWRFSTIRKYVAGSTLSAILIDLLAYAGLTSYWLDPEATTLTISGAAGASDLQWQIGTSVGLAVQQILQDFGWRAYFDVNGVFIARPFVNIADQTPVFALADTDACVDLMERPVEDTPEIANEIVVATNAPDIIPFQVSVADTTDGSITRADGPFGRRTMLVETPVDTVAQATEVAREELQRRSYLAASVDMTSLALPFLDVRDVVTLTSERLSLDGVRHYLASAEIPLGIGTMTSRWLEARDLGIS